MTYSKNHMKTLSIMGTRWTYIASWEVKISWCLRKWWSNQVGHVGIWWNPKMDFAGYFAHQSHTWREMSEQRDPSKITISLCKFFGYIEGIELLFVILAPSKLPNNVPNSVSCVP